MTTLNLIFASALARVSRGARAVCLFISAFASVSAAAMGPAPKNAEPAMAPVAKAVENPCIEFQPWIKAASTHPADSVAARAKAQNDEWKAREESALLVYRAYRAGTLSPQGFNECLEKSPSPSSFLNSLYPTFYRESVSELRVIAEHSPALSQMLSKLDSKVAKGMTPLFRLTGDSKNPSPTDLKGGFHRATGSIFMDFTRIPKDEWLLVLVHELLHSLDDRLMDATRTFSQAEKIKKYAEWAKTYSDADQLSESDRTELDEWLVAGLDRGLFAEYRAWVPTAQIYLEGLSAGAWPRIQWMEQALSEVPSNDLEYSIYEVLNRHSIDPTIGLFSSPLIKNELTGLRTRHDELPPL